MSVAATHPERDTLLAFANGCLPESAQAEVETHVAGCDTCCAILATADADSLVQLARQAADEAPSRNPRAASTITPQPDIPQPLRDHPRYRILSKLGEGGMGVVYKAEHRMMGRVVAVKVLNARTTAAAGSVDRFRREVRVASKLDHPNIVTAFDADDAGDLLFLVMEYIDGISLDKLVGKRGPLPIAMACQFARQTALALQHAHEKGMVHRDIKPHNLMVTRKGQLKVLDFGLARAVQSEGMTSSQTAAGMTSPELVVGTPDFLAPEQARNSTTVDIRADIYSLGCTLFFLLTGQTPFPGGHPFEKMIAHVQEPVPDSSVFRPEIPPALAMIVGQLMAKKAEDRPQTPLEVANTLAPFAKMVGPAPTTDSPGKPFLAALTPAPALPTSTAQDVTPKPMATVTTAQKPTAPRENPVRRKPKSSRKHQSEAPLLARHRTLIYTVLGLLCLAPLLAMGIHRLVRTPLPPSPADTPTDTVAQSTESPKPDSEGPQPDPVSDTNGANRSPSESLSRFAPPAGFAPLATHSARVLLVLPPRDLWLPDLGPLHRIFQAEPRVVLTTTSARSGRIAPHPQCPPPLKTIPADVALSDVNPENYDAVVFLGAGVEDYLPGGSHVSDVRRIIEACLHARKPIAAICLGQKVLGDNGYLDQHAAARSALYTRNGPRWEDRPVVVSTPFITAGTDQDAGKLAHAVLVSLGLQPAPDRGPSVPLNPGNTSSTHPGQPNPFTTPGMTRPNPFLPPRPGFGPRPRPPQRPARPEKQRQNPREPRGNPPQT